MKRRTNIQPWLLVTCIGVAILTAVLAFIFCYASIAHKLFPHEHQAIATTTTTAAADDGQLLHLTVIMCPGDRTPLRPYASDPWSAPHFWPVAWGDLSPIGRVQHAELGVGLRQRYAATGVWPPHFDASRVGLRSTGCSNRTRVGVGATLAGIFAELAPNDLVAVQCGDPGAPDGTAGDCRALREWRHWARLHWEQPRLAAHRNLTEYLQRHSADRMESLQQIGDLYDTLHVERLYGRRLPPWTQRVFPGGELAVLAAERYAAQAASVEMLRLRYGGVLREIVERWSALAGGGAEPATAAAALWLYGEERETLVGLMQALGVFDTHIPPYCAALLMEVRSVGGEPHVQLLYQRQAGDPEPLLMAGCGTLCSLGRMRQRLEAVMPEKDTQWDCEHLRPPTEANGAMRLFDSCRVVGALIVFVVIVF